MTNPATLKMQVVGQKIDLFINSKLVDSLVDAQPLANGRIGLGVIWSFKARFDDVIVTAL